MTQPRRIAIVDDEPSVRSGLSNLLQSEGYATIAFPSAEAFLNDGPARPAIALVIADLKLKGMSGAMMFERLQLSPAPPPVIFISGHDDETWQRYAGKPGAVAFLRKPIDIDILLEYVQRVLSNSEDNP
ncbi:response regulator transcription factor [Kosakonia oryzae]|uniref:Response regulator n=1 Tax=Kosakonia oryzae TaxID=497725 RepID=A0AA94KPF7_9ENTR|nr:response regulator [Kosakonia oryzae]ANI83033.1 response regulator [Kosakonia oryzae]SFC11941.1 Response regulator receiver domain-containing protein [Kosakonia oryzae]